MHDQVLSIALACERQMMEGITPRKRAILMDVMKRMLANLGDQGPDQAPG